MSPHLESLITHQLQRRVLQEAELLWDHARTRQFESARPREDLIAVLQDASAQVARTMIPAETTPIYSLTKLFDDAATAQELTEWLVRIEARDAAVCRARGDDFLLAAHRYTVPIAIALWRLAAWVDSAEPACTTTRRAAPAKHEATQLHAA